MLNEGWYRPLLDCTPGIPHIVPMYDVVHDGLVPALVMQYIAGPTLHAWIQEHGPIPWQDALKIGSQLADALSADEMSNAN